jgi:hypothetical protein
VLRVGACLLLKCGETWHDSQVSSVLTVVTVTVAVDVSASSLCSCCSGVCSASAVVILALVNAHTQCE